MIGFSHQQTTGIPVTLVPFHSSYSPGEGCSKAVRGWLIVPALLPRFRQATEILVPVSATPHLSHARVPGIVEGRLPAQFITQRPRRNGNS